MIRSLSSKHYNNMKNAPIAIFAYNRPECLRQVLDNLLKNSLASESDVIFYLDNAKRKENHERVNSVRKLAKDVEGFKNVTIVEREYNFGMAKNNIDGISDVLEKYGRAIFLEDDNVVGEHFLEYANRSLDLYEKEENIGSICGYIFPIDHKGFPETIFLRQTHSWAWATWNSKWSLFEEDGRILYSKLKNNKMLRAFDVDGAYPFSRMLKKQFRGHKESWSIRWYASLFLNNKLSLHPSRSLVKNIGCAGNGTNFKYDFSRFFEPEKSFGTFKVAVTKEDVKVNIDAQARLRGYLKKIENATRLSLIEKIKRIRVWQGWK